MAALAVGTAVAGPEPAQAAPGQRAIGQTAPGQPAPGPAASAQGTDRPYAPTLSWQLTPTGSEARLRGVAPVSDRVAWASGSLGTVLRTVDGGATWQQVGPPGTEELQFRDIEAFDAQRAVVLAIGEGASSRVYVTGDGGATWTLGFQGSDPRTFLDCVDFFDRRRGLVVGDPVDGRWQILSTRDGGRSWALLPAEQSPEALPGEFGFAASGQCLSVQGGRYAWIGTGGAAQARVLRSRDAGRSWEAVATPVRSGPSAGIFSVAFRDPRRGLAIGGDFAVPEDAPDALALSRDGGRSWRAATGPGEYRSGSAWVPRLRDTAVAVGPTGSDVSTDGGRSWTEFDGGSFDTVECARRACWAAGEAGRVARLEVRRR